MQMHIFTHAGAHTHTCRLTLTHAGTHTHTGAHTRTLRRTHTHMQAHILAHAGAHTYLQACTHTCAGAHTHTCRLTHTQVFVFSFVGPLYYHFIAPVENPRTDTKSHRRPLSELHFLHGSGPRDLTYQGSEEGSGRNWHLESTHQAQALSFVFSDELCWGPTPPEPLPATTAS